MSRAKVPAEETGSSRSMIRHWPMPVEQMPEAAALAAAVPDEPMPEGQMPVGAMPVGEKIQTKGEQGTMDVHAGPQHPAHLGQTELGDRSTDMIGRAHF